VPVWRRRCVPLSLRWLTGCRTLAEAAEAERPERIRVMRTGLEMQRCIGYSWAGTLLSVGAPLGLLALRISRYTEGWDLCALRRAISRAAQDRGDYVYVSASTAVVFSAFGFLLGRQADQLATLSRTDPLTGLLNARGLFERVNSELVRLRRRRAPLAMFVIDLDGLKTINDRHGHRAGDDALRSLAAVIRSQLRTTDVGARWGGDEFAILASNTSASAALAVAERIRALILQQSAASPLSASIGVATIDPSSERVPTDCDRLMRAADGAMYEAKQRGRNNVVLAKGQDQDGP